MSKFIIILIIVTNISLSSAKIPWQMLIDGVPPESKESQCASECCKSKYHYLDNPEFQSNIVREPYDVLNYELLLDFSDALHNAEKDKDTNMLNYFSGIQKMKIRIDSSDIKQIKINANEMEINFVEVVNLQNPASEFTYQYSNNIIRILNNINFNAGDTLIITINYRVSRVNRIGFYLFAPGEYQVGVNRIPVLEPLAYTFSQPSLARFWMPCNDKPYDKAISRISVTVPEGYTGVSNGLLDSVTIQNGFNYNTETFYWSHKSPISTYLMAASASKFGYYEQIYNRFHKPEDSIKIQNYMWQIDLDSPKEHPFNAVNALRNQPEMLSLYSSKFGEYTFEKYGTVAVHPFSFGGMEHQTMTTINRDWLRGRAEIGIAHEIAHHWIGDLVTCATWDDIWINEGGATWFEALWQEHINKTENWYYQHLLNAAEYYFKQNDGHLFSVYGVPEPLVFVKTYITYSKAGWVYHMLSEIIGRDNFNIIMNEIFENNKFKALTTLEFIDLIQAKAINPKMDLNKFFAQWLFDSGHIIYQTDLNQIDSHTEKYKYEITLDQIQTGEGFREVYEMPIDLVFTNEAGELLTIESVYNDKRSQKYEFEFNFPVKNCFVDNRKVLCKNSNIASSVKYDSDRQLSIFPNPASEYIEISTDRQTTSERVQLFNTLGIELYSESFHPLSSIHRMNIENLPAGVYFIKIGEKLEKFVKM